MHRLAVQMKMLCPRSRVKQSRSATGTCPKRHRLQKKSIPAKHRHRYPKALMCLMKIHRHHWALIECFHCVTCFKMLPDCVQLPGPLLS